MNQTKFCYWPMSSPALQIFFTLVFSLPLPPGIIDLSQVPHLPVLVPPSAGATSSPMDRITYIPGGSATFPGRPYTTSPISPGKPRPPLTTANPFSPSVLCSMRAFVLSFLCSWVFAHKQDAEHVV